MTSYESKSIAWWMLLLAALLGVAGITGLIITGIAGRPGTFLGVVCVAFALVLANFGVLTARVDKEFVAWRFGWGPVGRRIALQRVQSVEPRRSPWYWGWGIRWTPHGWLWRAYGLDAVWLELDSNKWIGVGTQDPKGLARAVRERKPVERD